MVRPMRMVRLEPAPVLAAEPAPVLAVRIPAMPPLPGPQGSRQPVETAVEAGTVALLPLAISAAVAVPAICQRRRGGGCERKDACACNQFSHEEDPFLLEGPAVYLSALWSCRMLRCNEA